MVSGRGAKDIIMDIKCCSLFCVSASCSSGVVTEPGMYLQEFFWWFICSFFCLDVG